MLYDCKEHFVILSKEIIHLKNDTALNELQIGHRGEITFETSTLPTNYTIAPLISIPFIENAFKHSSSSQSDGVRIHIKISITENGYLTFLCENSFLPETNNIKNGIGLINVEKRLNLLYPNI
jgi:LytS/YehU family sensor histidine kinase